MNKSFTRDDDEGEAPLVPPRAPLPEGVPNYVTPRGLALLRRELEALQEERRALDDAQEGERRRALASLAVRQAQLVERLSSAVLVEARGPQAGSGPRQVDVARFGTRVRVRAANGSETEHEIVGVDEANAGEGRVAFTSPLARALLGKAAGDVATVKTPRGEEEIEILGVRLSPS